MGHRPSPAKFPLSPCAWLAAATLLVACTKGKVLLEPEDPPPDEDDAGVAAPVQVSGVYLTMDFGNSRARCDYETVASGSYTVQCHGVTIQADGSELRASDIAKDVRIVWKEPAATNGQLQESHCNVGGNGLSFTCSLVNARPADALTVAIGMSVRKAQAERTETATVVLPYSVGIAAGFVPTIPFVYERRNSPAASGDALGFQPRSFDLTRQSVFTLANSLPFDSICTERGRIYFSLFTNIFVVDGTSLRLYAGSGGQTQVQETHRFRVNLGTENLLACFPGGVIVSDRHHHRILKMLDSGEVTTLAGVGRQGSAPDGTLAAAASLDDVVAVEVRPDNTVVFAENGTNRIRAIGRDGRLTTLATVEAAQGTDVERPWFNASEWHNRLKGHAGVPALHAMPDGSLLFANNAQVKRLTAAGKLEVLAGSGTFGRPQAGQAARTAAFQRIRGVAAGAGGSVFFADSLGTYRLTPAGTIELLTDAVELGSDGRPTSSTSARFLTAQGAPARDVSLLAVQQLVRNDVTGDLLIIEQDTLRRLTPDGRMFIITRFAPGSSELAECRKPTPSLEANLLAASGLTALQDGRLLLLTGVREEIPKTDKVVTGTRMVVSELASANGSGTLARLSHCTQEQKARNLLRWDARMASDGAGGLFIGDGERILRLGASATEFKPFATGFRLPTTQVNKATDFLGDANSAFESPVGSLAVSPTGELYAATTVVRGGILNGQSVAELIRLYLDGALDFGTLAAKGTGFRILKFKADGTAVEALRGGHVPASMKTWQTLMTDAKPWSIPTPGLAFLPNGALVYSLPWENRISLLSPDGSSSVLAGTGEKGLSGDGGAAVAAKLNHPTTLAVSAGGEIFFVDAGNRRVRRLTPRSDGSYVVDTFFGGVAQTDCGTGTIGGVAEAGAVAAGIQRSMAVLCQGQPLDLAIHDTCPAAGGRTRVFISQTFGHPNFNIVSVDRPCNGE